MVLKRLLGSAIILAALYGGVSLVFADDSPAIDQTATIEAASDTASQFNESRDILVDSRRSQRIDSTQVEPTNQGYEPPTSRSGSDSSIDSGASAAGSNLTLAGKPGTEVATKGKSDDAKKRDIPPGQERANSRSDKKSDDEKDSDTASPSTTQPKTTTVAPSTTTTTAPTTTTTGATRATTASADCDVTVSAPASIQSTVNSQPNGATICLSGTFQGQRVVPKDNQTFRGPAILDGGGSVRAAFDNGGADVTIRNLEVRNYASPVQNGAIQSGRGWNLYDSEVHNNSGGGVSFGGSGTIIDGNHIHHNGQIGIILQDADNSRVEDNELNDNNFRDAVDYGFESGGIKLLRSDNVVIRGNYAHDNHGPGLWSDHDNYNILYENNTATDNYGPGIFHEISYNAVIRNNTVTGNAFQFYVGGILVSSSSNVEVYGNNVSGNDGGIVGIQDSRGSGNRGTFQTTGLNVHDNKVSWTAGFHGVQVNSGPDVTNSNTISYGRNQYTASGSRPFKWGSSGSNLTWQQWQSLGHDTNGSFK